jgi:hypothetical protein
MQSDTRPQLFTFLLAATLLAATAQPAHAQLSELRWRIHGGVIKPLATGSEYFSLGPSVAVDAALPLGDRAELVLDLGWDYINTDDHNPTPVTNLWRYRVEVEGTLTGERDAGLSVSAFGGVGATTIYSHKFYLVSRQPYGFEGERLRGTSLTGTGGLRLGLGTPDGIKWWLTGKLNWTPLNDSNQDALHELSTNRFQPQGLDPISSIMAVSLTLGVSL